MIIHQWYPLFLSLYLYSVSFYLSISLYLCIVSACKSRTLQLPVAQVKLPKLILRFQTLLLMIIMMMMVMMMLVEVAK